MDAIRSNELKLLIATRNLGKFRELTSLLADCPFTTLSLAETGIDLDVAETGSTFEENASLKAGTAHEKV